MAGTGLPSGLPFAFRAAVPLRQLAPVHAGAGCPVDPGILPRDSSKMLIPAYQPALMKPSLAGEFTTAFDWCND